MTNLDMNLKRIGEYQQRVNRPPEAGTKEPGQTVSHTGATFETLLKEQLAKNTQLHFSKHAKQRVTERGIALTDGLMENLQNAVSKARDKGAKDVVIFDARNAFIVNIPNNTVVTTLSGSEMKENVFTNIDSAVIL